MKFGKEISRRHFVTGIMSSAALGFFPKAASAFTGNACDLSTLPESSARGPRERVTYLATPFPLEQVRLLDGPFLDAAKTNQEYLHSLSVDRLMHTFRINAGLPSSAEPIGGWEAPDCEIRGHFTGHFLSACALGYAATGDQELKTKGDAVVAEMAKCQQAHGNGYLSAFPEDFFDRLRDGKPVWVPFYTLHKIMAGNLDMYSYCHSQQALANAEGLAGWIAHWTEGISYDHVQRILKTEYGGTSESLYNLSAITGKEEYFHLAARFQQPDFFDPLAGHRDELKGLHVNTHIPKVIGAARRYELTGDPYYHEVASYFWEEVTQERAYATGGTSNREGWETDPGNLSQALSLWSEECCCGYNMLKLTRHLHQWNNDPRYMDYYERTLFNSRLGTQHPENGLKMYYLPLQTGFWKYFHSPLNSFWCCTGTGVEEFSKFGDSIYFHNADDVFVNLFISSEVRWPEKGLTLQQSTRFPEQEGSSITIQAERPLDAGINIRIPGWAVDGGSVEVNGTPLPAFSSPASYLRINRRWKDGDRLEVKLPMRLHAEALLGDPTQQAVLYGPIVLAGRLGAEGLTEEMQYDVNHGATQLSPPHAEPQGMANVTVKSAGELQAVSWIEPVKGHALTFQTVGQQNSTTLIPLHRVFGERYAVYWKTRVLNEETSG
ncbi:MAG: beta-L-arabinofuranosidase domain-containing protein [Candidatus Acidiferrales bacterium]